MMEIYTIGHSNVESEVFINSILLNKIDILVDVRSFPTSNYCPQFNGDCLGKNLADNGVKYIWMKILGGRRGKSTSNSVHDAIRNPSFRNYADYMMSDEFKHGINELCGLSGRVAYMCSEAVYWRCHRRMISDFLSFNEYSVNHINVANGKLSQHEFTKPSYWNGTNVIYSESKLLWI